MKETWFTTEEHLPVECLDVVFKTNAREYIGYFRRDVFIEDNTFNDLPLAEVKEWKYI